MSLGGLILKFWQVDSFATAPFTGNPAVVFVLDQPVSDELMQKIAMEMNQSETAFILHRGIEAPLLRWFTPLLEIDLCGHATLAAAHIWLSEFYKDAASVRFSTRWVGDLTVTKTPDGYAMDFPARAGEKIDVSSIPVDVLHSFSDDLPVEAWSARDLMLVYTNEDTVRAAKIDYMAMRRVKQWIVLTAPSRDYDFVSRFFCQDESAEDPVTGSTHCTLTPYWAARLGKCSLKAWQASKRGGALSLELRGERVLITGPALTVFTGEMKLS